MSGMTIIVDLNTAVPNQAFKPVNHCYHFYTGLPYTLQEALPGGCPRSLVGILKCLVSAFCQGYTMLSEI